MHWDLTDPGSQLQTEQLQTLQRLELQRAGPIALYLFRLALSAAAAAEREDLLVTWVCKRPSVSTQIVSYTSGLPIFEGTNVIPSDLFPSRRIIPFGSETPVC